MSGGEPKGQAFRKYLEKNATGLAYAGGLAAVSVFIAGSFRPEKGLRSLLVTHPMAADRYVRVQLLCRGDGGICLQ